MISVLDKVVTDGPFQQDMHAASVLVERSGLDTDTQTYM